METKKVLTIKGEKFFKCFVNNNYFCYSDRKKIYLYDFNTEKTRVINIKKAYSGVTKDNTALIYDEDGNLFNLNLFTATYKKLDIKVFPDLGLVWYEDDKIIAAEDIDGLNNRLFIYELRSNSKQSLTWKPQNILELYGLNSRGELIFTKLESKVQEIVCFNLSTKSSKTIFKAYNADIISVNPKKELYVFSRSKNRFPRKRKTYLSEFKGKTVKEISVKQVDSIDSAWISKGDILMLIEDERGVLFFDNNCSFITYLEENASWYDSFFESEYFVLVYTDRLTVYKLEG